MGVAIGLHQLAALPLPTALLVGASLSATDPVSVTALFQELGVGSRLTTLMEGESLLNDGMAVVAFGLLVGFSLGTTDLAIQPILLQFFTVVGLEIGLVDLLASEADTYAELVRAGQLTKELSPILGRIMGHDE